MSLRVMDLCPENSTVTKATSSKVFFVFCFGGERERKREVVFQIQIMKFLGHGG